MCNMGPRLQVLLEYFILRFAVQHVCLYYYIFPKYFILSARCDENQDYNIINMVCIDIYMTPFSEEELPVDK